MSVAMLEHVNITVHDPRKTADLLCTLFDWKIRWQGASMLDGHTVHVGTDEQYLALYSMPDSRATDVTSYEVVGALNHVGIHVDDLDAAQERIEAAGFKTFNHQDYEPGRRFYLHDRDNIEFEILSYTQVRPTSGDQA